MAAVGLRCFISGPHSLPAAQHCNSCYRFMAASRCAAATGSRRRWAGQAAPELHGCAWPVNKECRLQLWGCFLEQMSLAPMGDAVAA